MKVFLDEGDADHLVVLAKVNGMDAAAGLLRRAVDSFRHNRDKL